MTKKPTMIEAGYKFHKWLGHGTVVFQEIATGKLEVFGSNKNHASWGFSWHGTDWEFARDYDGQISTLEEVRSFLMNRKGA